MASLLWIHCGLRLCPTFLQSHSPNEYLPECPPVKVFVREIDVSERIAPSKWDLGKSLKKSDCHKPEEIRDCPSLGGMEMVVET